MTLGLQRGKVRLTPYKKAWRGLFKKEQKRLSRTLRSLAVDIQHIGSTAVAYVPAKPIMDIAVGVHSLKDREKIQAILSHAGYAFRRVSKGKEPHLLFVKGPESKRTHYLHVMKHNGLTWKQDLLFRDYLRTHRGRAKEYALLKKSLAQRFPNSRQEYTRRKAKFIHTTLRLAKKAQ